MRTGSYGILEYLRYYNMSWYICGRVPIAELLNIGHTNVFPLFHTVELFAENTIRIALKVFTRTELETEPCHGILVPDYVV